MRFLRALAAVALSGAASCGDEPASAPPACEALPVNERGVGAPCCGAPSECDGLDAGTCLGERFPPLAFCISEGCREDADCGGGALCFFPDPRRTGRDESWCVPAWSETDVAAAVRRTEPPGDGGGS